MQIREMLAHKRHRARDAYYFFAKGKFLLYPRIRASKFPSQRSRREYFLHNFFADAQSVESRKGTDTA